MNEEVVVVSGCADATCLSSSSDLVCSSAGGVTGGDVNDEEKDRARLRTKRERREGRARPRVYFSFAFPLSFLPLTRSSFGGIGEDEIGGLAMTETPPGTGYGYSCNSNTGAAAMAFRAACGRLNKTDNIHVRCWEER